MTTEISERPALPRRLMAILYDSLLMTAILILCAFVWVGISHSAGIESTWGLRIIAITIVITFYLYFWTKKGQTLGMTTWRLTLRSNSNQHPTLQQQVIRLIAAFFSLSFLGLGFLWMLIDKDKLTWHDRLSNTYLELLPKKS